MVVAQDWRGNEPPPIGLSPLFVFSESHAVGLQRPDGQVEVIDPEEPGGTPHALTWVKQPARGFRYELVFEGIANADHARRRPAISSRVYFINPASNVILHMYDDRGLDVIARNKRALDALYHSFNGWLLDYDRVRMEQAFEY